MNNAYVLPDLLHGSRLTGDPPMRRGHLYMYYTYVLQSLKNGRRYCGSTDNLKRRIAEHNSGIGGKYTSSNRPFILLFYEAYLDYKDAKASEKFYKTGYGREVLNEKLQNYLKSAE